MSKQMALYLMIGGALMSGYDLMTTPAGGSGGALYGAGKPLEMLRWNVYTSPVTTTPAAPAKNYYLSASDAAAVLGAYLYFF